MYESRSEAIVVPLISQENYRRCLYLGLVGVFAEIVILVVRWILYPQYINAILRGLTLTQNLIGQQIFFIQSSIQPISILIGLGFFGVLARNGMKESLLFLLIFLISNIHYPVMYSYSVENLVFLRSFGIDFVSSFIYLFITSSIMSIILLKKSESFTEQKLMKTSAILILLAPIVEFVWFFLSEPLKFYYDPLLSTTIGSIATGLVLAIPNLIMTLLSIVVFLKLFYKEIQADNADTPSIIKTTDDEEDDMVIISPPLVDAGITKYLLILGIIGSISMFIFFVLQSVLYSQYYAVLFSDGIIASADANQSLNNILQLGPTIDLAVGIGLFGIFSKSGQRTGYIFLIIFLFPVADILFSIIIPIALFIQASSSATVVYYGTKILGAIILAMLLWKNRTWISHRIVLGITSLSFVLFEIIQAIWNIVAADLHIQYDFMTLTAIGSYSNSMLYLTPYLVLHIVMSLILLILIISEVRTKEFRMVSSLVESRIETNSII